jgi:tRNA A-37 threonylcarbamoyl transferase component Bud32
VQLLPTLKAGAHLGAHEILGELGRGSSAVVYRARRTTSGGDVALKVRMRGDDELDRRFLREFESLRSIAIPGVVRVSVAGQTDQVLWYAMDAVRGVDIRTRIHDSGDFAERCRVATSVAPRLFDTLAAIHRHGLIHRDLKPTNVLVDDDDGIHLLDFGIVRWWAQEVTLTLKGNVVGTLPFMAPEQVAGLPVTFHADIFSAGLLLYEGIAGRRKRASGPTEWVDQQCLQRPPPLATLSPQVPRALSVLVDRMLDIDPLARPEAHEVGQTLRDIARGRVVSDWPEPPRILGRGAMVEDLVMALDGRGPRVRALVGPNGSGRRRVAEQIHRSAVLRGFRCISGRAAHHRVGGLVHELLRKALEIPADDRWRRQVGGDDPRSLLEMWPDLPLWSPSELGELAATRAVVAEQAAEALLRVAGDRSLLVIVEDFDQIDSFSERTLRHMSDHLPASTLLLLIVDDRWASDRARRLLKQLEEKHLVASTALVDLDGEHAAQIVQALAPTASSARAPRSAQRAVEEGWEALAAIRGEPFPVAPAAALPLALAAEPVPRAVLEALGADPQALVAMGLVREHPPAHYAIQGQHLNGSVLARLDQRADAEDRLADALERFAAAPERWSAIARHRAHGRRPARARRAAIHAAVHAQRNGRLNEAREWLLLIDELPPDPSADAAHAFDLAYCQAYTAIHTERSRVRDDLVAAALGAATDEEQHARAALLQAELHARRGNLRGALAQCLNRAAWLERSHADLAAQALRQAAQLRVRMGQPPEALALLDRAEAVRGGRMRDALQLQLDHTRADAVCANGDTEQSASICMEALATARRLQTSRDEAQLLLQLGHVTFMLGERVQAEGATWKAHRLFSETGDRTHGAESKLLLARLSLGKGDVGGASLLGSEALSVAESLRNPTLVHRGLALGLDLATTGQDEEKAAHVMERRVALGGGHPSWMVAEVRWWRTRRDLDRAVEAAAGVAREGYDGARLAIELARTHLEAEAMDDLRKEVGRAIDICRSRGFKELATLANLVLAAAEEPSEASWGAAVEKALASRWVELSLAALEMDGRRHRRIGNRTQARERFLTLQNRALDLHQRHYAARAERWLGELGT